MAKLDNPAAAAAKWKTNLSNARQAITDGVNGVTESPTAAAARNLDKYRMGVNDAVDSGRMQNALSKVTAADWKQSMIEKGIPRIATGASAAEAKVAANNGPLFAAIKSARASVLAMPNTTPDDRINRMVQFTRLMSQYKQR